MWLVLAAPASFFSLESASHLAVASVSHFFMKLVAAAPASFLSAESLLHVANALVVASESTAARIMVFIIVSSDFCRSRTGSFSCRLLDPTMLYGQKAAAFSQRAPYPPWHRARKSSRAARAAAPDSCGCSGIARGPAAPPGRRAVAARPHRRRVRAPDYYGTVTGDAPGQSRLRAKSPRPAPRSASSDGRRRPTA